MDALELVGKQIHSISCFPGWPQCSLSFRSKILISQKCQVAADVNVNMGFDCFVSLDDPSGSVLSQKSPDLPDPKKRMLSLEESPLCENG